MPASEIYKLINAIDNDKTDLSSHPFISDELRKLVNIPGPVELVDFNQQMIQANDELKKQTKDMQELLGICIKSNSTIV